MRRVFAAAQAGWRAVQLHGTRRQAVSLDPPPHPPTFRSALEAQLGNRWQRSLSSGDSRVRQLAFDEDGAALIEYGLLVMLVALLCIVAVKAIGTKVSNGFSSADSQLP